MTCGPGHPVRPLWVPPDHRDAPAWWLGGEPQTGGPDLTAGGAEGAGSAAHERTAVAEQRLLREAEDPG